MDVKFVPNIYAFASNNCAYPLELNGYYANCVLGDDGVLYVEEHAFQFWGDILLSSDRTFVPQPETNIQTYTPDQDSDNKNEIIKVLNTSVDHNGNIIELIVRKPRSEDERSTINERERDSKARDLRRDKGQSSREAERAVRSFKLC